MLNLVTRYLPRDGMAPEWGAAFCPLVVLFTAINLFVTWWFRASVSEQGAAYATGVMVLLLSASVAVVIDRREQARIRNGEQRLTFLAHLRIMPWRYVLIAGVFLYITAAIMFQKPEGTKIASAFILSILISSIISRSQRSLELRFDHFSFASESSRVLWDSLRFLEFPVIVPHRPGQRSVVEKERIIRQEHRLSEDVPIVFVEAILGDTSEFLHSPFIEVVQEEGRFIVRLTRCASVPHALASMALELSKTGHPPELHFGWSSESPLAANLSFLLFGQGNIPWLVRELVLAAEPNDELRPRVVIG